MRIRVLIGFVEKQGGIVMKVVANGAVVAFCAMLSVSPLHAQDAVRIGTSSVGSVFYTVAIGASEIIAKHAKINATVEPVGGSSANVRGLAAKRIEFALANSFAAFSGYNGTHNFKKPVDVRLVLQGQSSYRWLLVRKGSGVEKLSDLEGRTIVAKRRALPEIELVWDAMRKISGVTGVKAVATTNSPQAYKAFRAGSIDAAVMPFARRAAAVAKPMQDGVIDFLYLPKERRDAMLAHLPPMMWPATVPKGNFKGQSKDVHLVGLNTYFLARPDVSDEVVYKVAKAIFENTEEFGTYHKAALQWSLDRALNNVPLPFHDGVIRYFREAGLWTEAHGENQKRLLARK